MNKAGEHPALLNFTKQNSQTFVIIRKQSLLWKTSLEDFW